MTRATPTILLIGAACLGSRSTLGGPGVPRLKAITVASGLTNPDFVTAPPDDFGRLFLCELWHQVGSTYAADIKILNLRTGTLNPAPFLTVVVGPGCEGGLLGMAFDPDYAGNGYFYLHYTLFDPAGSYIVRYQVSADPDLADPTSATAVLYAPHSEHCQIGGWTEFGHDGYLYFSLGDLQQGYSQTLSNLFGKISRIDVHSLPYSIPPSNPFFGSTTARQEIFAYGLRNPWRCSLDRATGDLWIGDVGENTYEEIDFFAAPVAAPFTAPNFGWPCSEGPMNSCPPGNDVTLPIYSYPHSGTSNQYIIGGYVYRGAAVPELRGTYFFWRRGPDQVWTLRYDGTTISELTDRTAELLPPGVPLPHIVSFGQDAAGELYMASLTPGEVYKIIPRCWANCDGSSTAPVLGAADFACFITRFLDGDPYANCDGSTTPPTLNVLDFGCFLNHFAAGCS